MARYLFRFGYCTPSQWAANEAHGWEDESSSAFLVEADSPEAALAWGAEVAEAFVQALFAADGRAVGALSWKEARFAHWLEDSPEDAFPPEHLRKLPVVRVGELPEPRRL
jgi:hypothetical protein